MEVRFEISIDQMQHDAANDKCNDRRQCLVYPGVHFLKILNASKSINDLRINTHINNVCTMANRFATFIFLSSS